MRVESKTSIAKATLTLLTVVVSLILLGVLVSVLCAGLQINPFKERTTSFLVAAFVGLIGVAVVLVLLNVATNVSLIADARIAEMKVEVQKGILRRWTIAFIAVAVASVGLIFTGTYLSKEKYLRIVREQADDVLEKNRGLLEEVSRLLASDKPEDYKRINEIRNFLENQRTDLPQLTLIYAGHFEGKLTFYSAVYNYWNEKNERPSVYTPTYFRCTQTLDCEYLTKFFSGENVDVFQKYTMRDDQFYIYIPFVGKEARYVLLFDRRNRYGKVGS